MLSCQDHLHFREAGAFVRELQKATKIPGATTFLEKSLRYGNHMLYKVQLYFYSTLKVASRTFPLGNRVGSLTLTLSSFTQSDCQIKFPSKKFMQDPEAGNRVIKSPSI